MRLPDCKSKLAGITKLRTEFCVLLVEPDRQSLTVKLCGNRVVVALRVYLKPVGLTKCLPDNSGSLLDNGHHVSGYDLCLPILLVAVIYLGPVCLVALIPEVAYLEGGLFAFFYTFMAIFHIHIGVFIPIRRSRFFAFIKFFRVGYYLRVLLFTPL